MFFSPLPRPPGCALRPGLSNGRPFRPVNANPNANPIVMIITVRYVHVGLKGRNTTAQVEGHCPEAWVNGPTESES